MKQLSYFWKAFTVLLLIISNSPTSQAQNLIANPSFEDFTTCPTDLNQINLATSWFSITDGEPDYFNACTDNNDIDVPNNVYGTQGAGTGGAYAGLIAFGENEIRDYIGTMLTQPMEVGKSYCVEFKVSLSDDDFYGIQEMGMYFTTNPINISNGATSLNVTPQIYHMDDIITTTDDWYQITAVFTADQPYQYVALGNFFSNANTTGGGTFPGAPDIFDAYYFIDDVYVQGIEEQLIIGVDSQFVCIGDLVNFIANGSTTGEYIWYEENTPNNILGTTSTLSTTIGETGNYVVEAMIGNCLVRDTAHVDAVPAPMVNFLVENACVDVGTQFVDLSQSVLPNAMYEWDINNDGTIESTSSGAATYIFTEPGVYDVSLTIHNNEFCFRSIVNQITVSEECNPCENPVNFVPNGEVEEFSMCPDSLNATMLTEPLNWVQATSGTSDFFHSCVLSGEPDDFPGVPANNFGNEAALSGNGYLGFYAYRTNTLYREYLSVQLTESLEVGTSYCVSFNVSLADNAGYGVEEIGAYFSDNAINQNTFQNLTFTPQIQNDNGIITETNGWVTISGIVTPTTPVQYLTIGNFNDDDNTTTGVSPSGGIPDFGYNQVAYYYLDDIAVSVAPSIMVEDIETCAGETITLSAPEGFCSYEWYLADDPNMVLGNTNEVEWMPNQLGQIILAVSGGIAACTVIDTVNVDVAPLPDAFFNVAATCVDEAAVFTDLSSDVEAGSTYEWDFDGDGTIDETNEGSASTFYSEGGIYTVTVTISTPSGCGDTYATQINVADECDECTPTNLTFNPGFEFFGDCPTALGQIAQATDWFSPFAGDPDFYNGCSTNGITGVPNNANGTVNAFEGQGYAGIVAYENGINTSEYITTPLPTPLTVGQQYCLSFQVYLAPNSGFAIDKLGGYFSVDANIPQPNTITPQAVQEDLGVLSEQGWVEVAALFTANQAYEYLTLGNFYDTNELEVLEIPGGNGTAYYYIDKVNIIPVDLEIMGDNLLCQGEETTLTADTDLCDHAWTIAGGSEVISTTTEITVSPITTTTYIYTGSNNICEEVVMSYTVQVDPMPELGDTIILCPNDSTTLSDLNNSGATTYTWQPATGLSCTDCPMPTASPSVTTTYTLTVQYDTPTSCNTVDEVTIEVTENFASINVTQNEICSVEETTLMATGGDSYEWSPTTGLDNPNSGTTAASPTETTTYTVSVTNSGCVDTETVTITVFDCDLSGPDWQDATGASISEQCDEIIQDEVTVIELPDIEDLDIPNGEDELSIEIIEPSNGTVSDISETSVTYTPNEGFIGNDSLYVIACDTAFPVQCDTLLLCLTIINTAPNFVGFGEEICLNLASGATSTQCFGIEDVQDDFEDLTWTILYPTEDDVTSAQSITIEDSCLVYVAGEDFTGLTEYAVVEACDSDGACDTITVNYNIYAENAPPNIPTMPINTIQGLPIEFCLDITDDAGSIVTTEIITTAGNGTLEQLTDSCFLYTPNLGFEGEDSFVLEACDDSPCTTGFCDDPCNNEGLCSGEVTIGISVEDGLEAVDDFSDVENGETTSEVVVANDTPSVVDDLLIIGEPSNGSASVIDDGELSYNPENDFIGLDTVIYVICVEALGCDTALWILDVQNLLDANFDEYTTLQNTPIVLDILDNDIYPSLDSITIEIQEPPINGDFVINADGTVTYIPDDGYVGEDEFSYTICVESIGCDPALVIINMTEALPPIAENDSTTTDPGIEVTIDILDNDFDPQGDSLEIKDLDPIQYGPNNGTAEIIDGMLVYTPDNGFYGMDTILYRVCNSYGLSDFGRVYITVLAPSCGFDELKDGIMGGISPNGDGLNDEWIIQDLIICDAFKNNFVRVFNRWGNVVFDANNYGSEGAWWNGTWENNGEALPVGTYFYAIDIEGVDPKDCPRGSIEVFR